MYTDKAIWKSLERGKEGRNNYISDKTMWGRDVWGNRRGGG